ncbi:RNA-directed DNA polymerase from mobile element jockey [Araneus ventricosus]|uniref:RNA-directed DNA polymerase from mobile element jockey n=1 Tax=Araneus ventricosus TaxID=182803 RepID=A0A4Y2FKI7_ARAVE|nr:RNA-directed DNA polymerase from mobile element jockey [Araneus ventricosus]
MVLNTPPLGKENASKFSLENSLQTNPEPYDDAHIDEVNRAIRRYIDNPKPSSNIKLTSPQEILSLLKRINPRKATGPDGIPNKALKQIPTNVITFITKICNKCLLCNYFPTIWKTAHVLMFPKPRQNRKLPGNYRPISLLSNIGKIFEKIILSRLKEECLDLSIIPNEQYGFRADHGCTHQLLRVANTVTQGFNHKFYTGGVFLDVRKAFDRMWHNGLIYKLIKFKIPNYLIDILINYLRNRTFRVKLNHTLSDIGSIKAGTPQGSILSPLLYTIYTSDFLKTNQIMNCFFADDTAILSQGTSRKELNTLSFFDEDLTWDKEVKYLGLILDDKLTFRSHLKYNTEKFWAKVHLLIPLIGRRSPLTLENKLLLFKQVLRPILMYAAQIWGLAAFSNRKKAQILQNKILRIIVNAPWYVRNSVIHNDLKIQTIDEFIKELSRNFFQKLVNHTNPTVLDQLNYTHNNGKYAFPYATTKWSSPLKPP